MQLSGIGDKDNCPRSLGLGRVESGIHAAQQAGDVRGRGLVAAGDDEHADAR